MALKILYRSTSLRIDLMSTVKATGVTKGQGLYSRFGIPADNFRTNIATGKIFTSLCFFRQGTPNYVYIYLKSSLSNLTLGPCKFDFRSMSKTSKLCQVVYHSTRLDETKVFKPLCGYSGSKDNYQKQNQCSIRKGICNK